MPAEPDKMPSTQWTLVLKACRQGMESSRAMKGALIEAYWFPLYAYLRRKGIGANEAEDLVQGFFCRILETDGLATVAPERGRFRSYLLAALRHYVSNERARAAAVKRGGDRLHLPLATQDAEARLALARGDSPEDMFERGWALALLDRVFGRIQTEARDARVFERLKGFLIGLDHEDSQARAALDLGMSEAAVKAAVHRLRQRFKLRLRQEVRATVSSDAEVDDEIRALVGAVSR